MRLLQISADPQSRDGPAPCSWIEFNVLNVFETNTNNGVKYSSLAIENVGRLLAAGLAQLVPLQALDDLCGRPQLLKTDWALRCPGGGFNIFL